MADEPQLSEPQPGDPPGAILFDLDGTLVDNMGLHSEAFLRFAERHGLQVTERQLRVELAGMRNKDIFPVLVGGVVAPETLEQYSDQKESIYREISRGRLTPVAGLGELLAVLAARGIPVGLATSAPRPNVAHTLEELDLADHFEVIVRGDEVARGKPHPDVFLECARRLNVAPERCVGFEDALPGIESIRAAGMRCIALSTTLDEDRIQAHGGAHLVVRDFEHYLDLEGGALREPSRRT